MQTELKKLREQIQLKPENADDASVVANVEAANELLTKLESQVNDAYETEGKKAKFSNKTFGEIASSRAKIIRKLEVAANIMRIKGGGKAEE